MIQRQLRIIKSEKANNIFTFTASTSTEDRYGDVIEQGSKSWALQNYEQNPVVLFNHNALSMPVGKGIVEATDDSLIIDIEMDTGDPIGAELARKMDAGFLHAVSVGFRPIEVTDRSKLPKEHKAYGTRGRYFTKSELLEVSLVTVPANGEATAIKSLNQEIEQQIKTLIRGELLTVPSLQLRHILSVEETEDKIVVSFAKMKEEIEEPEIEDPEIEDPEMEEMDQGYSHDDDEEDHDDQKTYNLNNPKSIDALASYLSEI